MRLHIRRRYVIVRIYFEYYRQNQLNCNILTMFTYLILLYINVSTYFSIGGILWFCEPVICLLYSKLATIVKLRAQKFGLNDAEFI